MTNKEFVVWMKGFMTACNDFTATPKQWDEIKDNLDKVKDNKSSNTYTTQVWNDQLGKWHYINYPEGFGYYINSTLENKKKENE